MKVLKSCRGLFPQSNHARLETINRIHDGRALRGLCASSQLYGRVGAREEGLDRGPAGVYSGNTI